MHDYADAAKLSSLPAMLAWSMHKIAMRAAADAFRRRLLAAPYPGAVPELIALTSMARAISRRDVRLALALRAASPTARRYLLVEHTSVMFAYPMEFTEHRHIVKANHYDELKGDAPTIPSKARGGKCHKPQNWCCIIINYISAHCPCLRILVCGFRSLL